MPKVGQRVAVLGAGSWGTAIARVAGEVGPTTLWCRSPETAALLIRDRVNDRYLPGASFPENLAVSSSIIEAVLGASLVLVVIPSHGFRSVLSLVADHIAPGTPVISLTKGIEDDTCVRMHANTSVILNAFG